MSPESRHEYCDTMPRHRGAGMASHSMRMVHGAGRREPTDTRRRAFIVGLLVLATLGTQAQARFAATAVRVFGRLTGRQGVALKDGEISLEPEPAGVVRSTRTDDAGLFSFEGVETGRYHLRIRYASTDGSGVVDVTEDQRIEIALDVDP